MNVSRAMAWATRCVGAIVAVSTVASNVESYMGLRAWSLGHGDAGLGADIFPLFIDAFPVAAEVLLFVATHERWEHTKFPAWVIITLGLALSVSLNVGHLASSDWMTLATQGLPPVASWLSMLVGSVMFERIMANAPARESGPENDRGYPEMPADFVADLNDRLAEMRRNLEDTFTDLDDLDNLDVVEDDAQGELPAPASPLDEVFRQAEELFADDIARGHRTGIGKIKKHMKGGEARARKIQEHLDSKIIRQKLAA